MEGGNTGPAPQVQLRVGTRGIMLAALPPASTAPAQDLRSAAEWRRWEHVGSSEPWREHKRQVTGCGCHHLLGVPMPSLVVVHSCGWEPWQNTHSRWAAP